MIVNYKGTKIYGSANLQTSVAGEEIIPSGIGIMNFQLINNADCHVSLNGGDYIYIPKSLGLNIPVVNSCKIQENGVQFSWIGMGA